MISLPSLLCGACLIFLVRRIQPFLSLVDREVELCVRTNDRSPLFFFFFFSVKKNPSSVFGFIVCFFFENISNYRFTPPRLYK